jgi:hypothetical protein
MESLCDDAKEEAKKKKASKGRDSKKTSLIIKIMKGLKK